MSNEEIIDGLTFYRLKLQNGIFGDRISVFDEAIAMLRTHPTAGDNADKSSDTSARLAAIKDIPTQRLIELAVAEAAGLISISPSAAELAHQGAQPNEPLTLEELRLMGGLPVWVETPGVDREISGRWVIVDGVNRGEKALFTRGDFTCHDYGTVWLAYRRPPKEA